MFWFIVGFVIFILVVLFVLNHLLSPTPLDLKNSHVVVTGGSSGIGLALAIEAVKKGANVTIVARREKVLQEAKLEIQKHITSEGKQKVLTVPLDLTRDYNHVKQEIGKAEKELGAIDMLINSAGFSIGDYFENITLEEFQSLMNVNYFASVSATKAVIGGMKSRSRGRIVLVSSQAGQLGVFGFTAYSGSKFALRGFAEALAMETKAHNVYVTLAFPADTDTPGYQEEMKRKPKESVLISETSGLFEPEPVAKVILQDAVKGRFLSSVGLDGFMLSTLTAGMTPVVSVWDALVQISLMSIFRAVSFFYLISFDRIVAKCQRESKNKQQ